MKFVVDSSVTLSWCFHDEQSTANEALLRSVVPGDLHVPPIWHLEMTNVLGVALRQGRLKIEEMPKLAELFRSLQIRTDRTLYELHATPLLELMQQFRLTAYDAGYLELSLRLRLPLATFDLQIREAADRCGVPLVL